MNHLSNLIVSESGNWMSISYFVILDGFPKGVDFRGIFPKEIAFMNRSQEYYESVWLEAQNILSWTNKSSCAKLSANTRISAIDTCQ